MKKELRNKYRKIRREASALFSAEELSFSADFFTRRLIQISSSLEVLMYASVKDEFPTPSLFLELKRNGFRTFFPKLSGDHLHFYEVKNWNELENTGFLLEPRASEQNRWRGEKFAAAFIPGLVFHRKGQRVGYGRAFYDRFLSAHPQVCRIGLAFNEQISSTAWEVEAHDQALDYIFSPSGIWGSPRNKAW